jgi:hypothetical protein
MTYFCYAGVLWTWVIVGTLVLAIFVLAVGGERWIGTPKRRLRHPALVAIVVLFTVNGASPYLGLKSETSLTMYSNLRTEGDLSNHLFAPEIMRVAPYMDTLVYIEESDHPVLKTYVGTSYGLVDLMFTDIVQQPIARTVYRRNGKRFVIEKAADIPEQYPWILRKVLGFRPVDSGPVKCSH